MGGRIARRQGDGGGRAGRRALRSLDMPEIRSRFCFANWHGLRHYNNHAMSDICPTNRDMGNRSTLYCNFDADAAWPRQLFTEMQWRSLYAGGGSPLDISATWRFKFMSRSRRVARQISGYVPIHDRFGHVYLGFRGDAPGGRRKYEQLVGIHQRVVHQQRDRYSVQQFINFFFH